MNKLDKLDKLLADVSSKTIGLADSIPLYEKKILDSFDVLRLITEIELNFGVKIDLLELLQTDLSKSSIRNFIHRRPSDADR